MRTHRSLEFVALVCALAMAVSAADLAAQTPDRTDLPPLVSLPDELDVVLRSYEEAWAASDATGLAALFTEDGFVLRPGHPPTVGREAIEEAYAGSGGPLVLRAYSYATEGDVGYIIGGFTYGPSQPEAGKFVLALRRAPSGEWLIAADMDNGNR